jgi:excisionase family DNA binding protein
MSLYSMTPKQAAKRVGCSHTTILRAIHRNQLVAKKIKIPILRDQEWYSITIEDLDKWNSGPNRRKRKK